MFMANEDFVNLMLEKSKKKENVEAQSRTGTKEGVSQDEVAKKLKEIQDRLQQE